MNPEQFWTRLRQRSTLLVLLSALVAGLAGLYLFYQANTPRYPEFSFTALLRPLQNWAPDVLIQGCSTEPFKDESDFAIICNVFSPSKSQSRLIIWTQGRVEQSNPITLSRQYTDLVLQKPNFNALEDIQEPLRLLPNLYLAGAAPTNRLLFSIGEATLVDYGEQYVWKVEERTGDTPDSGSTLVNIYYFDARTGEKLR